MFKLYQRTHRKQFMRGAVIVALLLAVLVCGCVGQNGNIGGLKLNCTPDYVYYGYVVEGGKPTAAEQCKADCYAAYKLTAFKLEGNTLGAAPYFNCYCDINNCNPT
jgi:hypothetical protein